MRRKGGSTQHSKKKGEIQTSFKARELLQRKSNVVKNFAETISKNKIRKEKQNDEGHIP